MLEQESGREFEGKMLEQESGREFGGKVLQQQELEREFELRHCSLIHKQKSQKQ
jgi:hypothetical protein